MPNCLLKPLTNGLLMGKILAAALAATPIRLSTNDKPYLLGTLSEIEKSKQSTARTITHTRLKDEIRSETVLHKPIQRLVFAVSHKLLVNLWQSQSGKHERK